MYLGSLNKLIIGTVDSLLPPGHTLSVRLATTEPCTSLFLNTVA